MKPFLDGCALFLVFAAILGMGQAAFAGNLSTAAPTATESAATASPAAASAAAAEPAITAPATQPNAAKQTAARPTEDPVALYNRRQYPQALAMFKDAAKKNPKDTKAHYYMAMCYQGMNQIKKAQNEYMWVYKNGSDQRMRYSAWSALANIERWNSHRAYEGQGNVFAYRSNQPPVYRPSAVVPIYIPLSGSA